MWCLIFFAPGLILIGNIIVIINLIASWLLWVMLIQNKILLTNISSIQFGSPLPPLSTFAFGYWTKKFLYQIFGYCLKKQPYNTSIVAKLLTKMKKSHGFFRGFFDYLLSSFVFPLELSCSVLLKSLSDSSYCWSCLFIK